MWNNDSLPPDSTTNAEWNKTNKQKSEHPFASFIKWHEEPKMHLVPNSVIVFTKQTSTTMETARTTHKCYSLCIKCYSLHIKENSLCSHGSAVIRAQVLRLRRKHLHSFIHSLWKWMLGTSTFIPLYVFPFIWYETIRTWAIFLITSKRTSHLVGEYIHSEWDFISAGAWTISSVNIQLFNKFSWFQSMDR